MNKDNDICEEIDRLIQRRTELENKLGGTNGKSDKFRKPTITEEEKIELGQLHKRLKQLKEEEDKSLHSE